MNYILFDEPFLRENLKPFTFTRPICEIRVGILTIREKWEKHLKISVSTLTENYLQEKFPLIKSEENILINGSVYPDKNLIVEIHRLEAGQCLVKDNTLIAIKLNQKDIEYPLPITKTAIQTQENEISGLHSLTDIFVQNAVQIQADFQLITQGRKSQAIEDKHTIVYHPDNIFLEEGVNIKASVLNAEKGPIYIGKNTLIQEGTIIQGNFALCEEAILSPGSKMRGNSTVGPGCKVGGELSNSVLFANSNKSHDGFLGNSVLGEWCNLGADTNNSNLKNNYSTVKLWNYARNDFVDTGRQFCGLLMGDHSKAGINTMFNTGTVVGVSANIFGAGYPPKFIPSFAWGGAEGFTKFDLEKAFETAQKMMERRNMNLAETDKSILQEIYKQSFQ